MRFSRPSCSPRKSKPISKRCAGRLIVRHVRWRPSRAMESPMYNAAVQHARLDAAMTQAIEALYPIDPQTGLRLYNPEGVRTTDINQLLEITDEQTHPDRRADRAGSPENCRSRRETAEDHIERARRSRAARVRRESRTQQPVQGERQSKRVNRRDVGRQLNVLATTLRRMSREMLGLRRSVTVDARRLVELECALGAGIRSLRRLQRQIEERR
jgi:hypothetical protein